MAMEIFGSKEFMEVCKREVAEYFNDHIERPDITEKMSPEDVYVVWYCKTLQNHKALLSTPVPDKMYYECTYNGDKNELYLDAYENKHNRCINLG